MILKYLINVFNVWPAFLLPVFTDDNDFFFEKTQNNCIKEFIIADLKKFEKCFRFEINQEKKVSLNSKAIYAVGFSEFEYIYGESKSIIFDYQNNPSKYDQDETFKKSFLSFVEKYITTITIYKKKTPKQLPDYRIKSWIHYLNLNTDIKKKCYENENSILILNNRPDHKTNDIYYFKCLFENACYWTNEKSVMYQKSNSNVFKKLSFEKQIRFINTLIYTRPIDSYKITSRFSAFSFVRLSFFLWNKESVYELLHNMLATPPNRTNHRNKQRFFSIYDNMYKEEKKNIQDIISEWHLNITKPILDLNQEFKSIDILDYFTEQILLESEQEKSKVYLFNIIPLSNVTNTNMIVAQNFQDENDYYFKIVENGINVLDIISFLELLYKEHKRKISIIINDNEIYNNPIFHSWIDNQSEWLSVKSLPFILDVNA